MRPYSRIALLAILVSCFGQEVAEAKLVGNYGVRVRVDSDSSADLLNAALGFRCTTSSTVSFAEQLPDNQGRMRQVPRSYSSRSNFLSGSTQHVMDIEKNMSRSDENLDVRINQTCTKDVPVERTRTVDCKTDRNGREYGCRTEHYWATEEKQIEMNWRCEFRNTLPTQVNAVSSRQCHPESHDFGFFPDLEQALMRSLNRRQISVDAKLRRVDERYLSNLCDSSNKQNRIVLQLSQGLGGHVGEDDFEIKVRIDGRHEVNIPVSTGLLDDEISYCGGGETVKLEISGVERDLFFDDHYVPQNSLELTRVGVGSQGAVRLKRKSYFGATDRDHEILVRATNRPAQQNTGDAASAGAASPAASNATKSGY